MTKPFKYLIWGIGDGHPCPFFDYWKEVMGFILFGVLAELGWLILPALALMPVIGYLVGRRRHALKV